MDVRCNSNINGDGPNIKENTPIPLYTSQSYDLSRWALKGQTMIRVSHWPPCLTPYWRAGRFSNLKHTVLIMCGRVIIYYHGVAIDVSGLSAACVRLLPKTSDDSNVVG